ncbi:MAG TPA: hypothetical protein VKB88_42940 [Bryobacteraceae bacterium]|nr:hypothetical protein [Bryobacteraceae bacterium]
MLNQYGNPVPSGALAPGIYSTNVTPPAFNPPSPIQVQVNRSGLAPGVYEKNIVFTHPAGNCPFTAGDSDSDFG